MSTPDPRYPIGDFQHRESITEEDIRFAIDTLSELPMLLREAVRDFDDAQLDTPYRDGGWTVRQLVHHIGDSHLTALHRLKKALTEDWPIVTGYDEQAFAELHDSTAPVEWSLDAIEGTHARWVMLLQSMPFAQFAERGFKHAERGPMKLDHATMLYAWHSLHHAAHITNLRAANGW